MGRGYKIKEVFTENTKAIIYLFHKYPNIFISFVINSIYSAIIPYFYLYLSALLIKELSQERRIEIILNIIFFSLIATLVFEVIGTVLHHWESYCNDMYSASKEEIWMNKFLELKYKDIDSPHTYDLLAQIHRNESFAGFGLSKTIDIIKKMFSAITKIIGAMVLCWSLFTIKVVNPEFSYLNTPIFALILFIIMIGVAVISPIISNKAKSYWAGIAGKAHIANRLFSFYGYLAYDHDRALDIRIYNQNKLCEKSYQKFNAFRLGGEVANCAKGYMGIMLALSVAISYILTGIVYLFVCLKAWAGAFGVGSVTQYIGALTAMSGGISELLSVYGDMYTNTEFLKTVFELLDMPIEDKHVSWTGCNLKDSNYKIEFKNVYFKYPNSSEWVLRNINYTIKEGEKIAIVGENGSGKTTFVKLLCRLYEPDKGEILLNGVNIQRYNYGSYIAIISAIFQDFNLVSQPIKNNIAASGEVDENKVWKSIEEVGMKELIEELPEKINTYLYKDYSCDGIYLSGGEEQKLAISRAFYKESRYLVLDEPTAALDPISESEIYKRLYESLNAKTMIFISHRLSSCIFCDEILVFKEGEIVEHGKHEDLLQLGGKYSELWNVQVQYYVSIIQKS